MRADDGSAALPGPQSRSAEIANPGFRWGGKSKRKLGHDYCEDKVRSPRWRKADLSSAAVARYRRVSAHDRAAVCRPRKVCESAGGGSQERYIHPARDTEERWRRRSGNRLEDRKST